MCKAVFEDNSPAKASGTRLVPERGLERNRVEASKLKKKKKHTQRETENESVCVCESGELGVFFLCVFTQTTVLVTQFIFLLAVLCGVSARFRRRLALMDGCAPRPRHP